MNDEKAFIGIAFAILVIFLAVAVPLLCATSNGSEPTDRYTTQAIGEVKQVDSPLGKYSMTIAPGHTGEFFIKNVNNNHRVPFIVTGSSNYEFKDFTFTLHTGNTYTLYFNTLIDPLHYEFVIHWKE